MADISKGERYGRWQLVRRIGRGGNGQVWLGRDAAGAEVAIKIMPIIDSHLRITFLICT